MNRTGWAFVAAGVACAAFGVLVGLVLDTYLTIKET